MGIEWIVIGLALLIGGYIVDKAPATRPAVRTAASRGGKAAVGTAKKSWSDRRAARRKKAAAWWKATKPRRTVVKAARITGKAVTSAGAFTRDAVVVVAVAGAAGAKEAAGGWKEGREQYKQSKADSTASETADSPATEPEQSADSTIPQPRTGEDEDARTAADRWDDPLPMPVAPGGQEPGTGAAGTALAVEGSALMTQQQQGMAQTAAGEHVDLSGVLAWCDAAFSTTDGSEVIGYVNSGKQLYENFGGAISGIGGAVAAAAHVEQEAAQHADEALGAWGEAILHLRQTVQEAIGG